MRLDADVLAHFRAGGKGYEARINAVLRQAMRIGRSDPDAERIAPALTTVGVAGETRASAHSRD